MYSINVLNGKRAEIKWFYFAPLTIPLLLTILSYFNINFTGIKTSSFYEVKFKEAHYLLETTISSLIVVVIYLFIRYYRNNYENFCERKYISKFTTWVFLSMGSRIISHIHHILSFSHHLNRVVLNFIKYSTIL